MRVIAGTAKGRKLNAPRRHLNIRPALDKVKGAIFNILYNIEGLAVLDLFAGTGAIGIEALSRGAAHATFVDSSNEAITIMRKNISLCSFQDKATIFPKRADIAIDYFARHKQKFDLIFASPPYLKDLVNPALQIIAERGILAEGGQIIVEHSPKEQIKQISGLVLTSMRKYGQTLVSFLCPAK